MSGLVFIDDENNNVLDEWMNETSSFVKGSTDIDIGEPVAGTSKGGLGFVETKSGGKQGEQSNKKPVNKLANKKRALAHEDDELHGVVEHIEESRTSIKGKPVKPVAFNNKKENVQSKASKKTKPNPVDPKPVLLESKVTGKDSNGATQTVTADSNSATEETVEQRENSRKRKRTKTRSKQKNIRRDNRPAESKPAYLHAGSKEFKGRPLTEQTKSVLGLTKKA